MDLDLVASIVSNYSVFAMNDAPNVILKGAAVANIDGIAFFVALYYHRNWILEFKHNLNLW